MAVFRPFQGIRPKKDKAAAVCSLPYDVMSREEAAAMARENPESFLCVSRAEIEIPQASPYDACVYEKARENLDAFLHKGILFQEETPVYYIYRQIMNGRVQTGLVGCASIDDYENGIIRRHEFTRREKEVDRICHFDSCDCNTEPIFLTYRKNEGINRLVRTWLEGHQPEYDFQTEDGIRHILWIVDGGKEIAALRHYFAQTDALYIADGHHRTASAAAVGQKRRAEHPNYTGDEEFNYVLAVAFPDEDLYVMGYHRVVEDLNGLSAAAFLDRIAGRFTVEKSAVPLCPGEKHSFGLYLAGQWYCLKAKEGTFPADDPVDRLDAAILQNNLLGPILGIQDPRTDKRIDFVGGIRGLGELERRAGRQGVAFSLYPITIADLMNVADSGQVMPPKSTWFEPKLRSGLFLHKLC